LIKKKNTRCDKLHVDDSAGEQPLRKTGGRTEKETTQGNTGPGSGGGAAGGQKQSRQRMNFIGLPPVYHPINTAKKGSGPSDNPVEQGGSWAKGKGKLKN